MQSGRPNLELGEQGVENGLDVGLDETLGRADEVPQQPRALLLVPTVAAKFCIL